MNRMILATILVLGTFGVINGNQLANFLANGQGPRFTHIVFFDISIGGEPMGRILIGLFGEVVPKTVENFVELSRLPEGQGYKGSKFHRVVPNVMIQGGGFMNGDGTVGQSIYGGPFRAENFEIENDRPQYLSMTRSKKGTTNTNFFISFRSLSWLSGWHVVFGQIIGGSDVFKKMNTKVFKSLKPYKDIVISNCGEIEVN